MSSIDYNGLRQNVYTTEMILRQLVNSAIVLTSICTLGLTTISLAEGTIEHSSDSVIKELQLQKLDRTLRVSLNQSQKREIKPPSKPQQKPPSEAIALIKEFEGFESQAYVDTDGTPVIGYGLSKIGSKKVKMGDRISPKEADTALNAHLQEIYRELEQTIEVQLSDRQLGALASISFNVGVNAIKNSTLVEKINTGDFAGAANEFLRWDKANMRGQLVRLPGLTRRRQAERQLFLQNSNS